MDIPEGLLSIKLAKAGAWLDAKAALRKLVEFDGHKRIVTRFSDFDEDNRHHDKWLEFQNYVERFIEKIEYEGWQE